MRTTFLALPLLLLAACGGDGGGDRTALPNELRLVKVSGDGQRAPVASTGPSASVSFRASVSSVQGELLPDPLVASIVVQGPAANRMGLPTGSAVRMDKLPAGTTVEFGAGVAGVPGDNPKCGTPFVRTVLPGDSARAVNRWAKGTLAATCVMRTRLLVGSEPMQSDSFTAIFTPGPYVGGYKFESGSIRERTVVLPPMLLRDKHDNPIPYRAVSSSPFVVVQGTEFGTEAARTVVWTTAGVAANSHDGTLTLVDAGGSALAVVQFRIVVVTGEFVYVLGTSL